MWELIKKRLDDCESQLFIEILKDSYSAYLCHYLEKYPECNDVDQVIMATIKKGALFNQEYDNDLLYEIDEIFSDYQIPEIVKKKMRNFNRYSFAGNLRKITENLWFEHQIPIINGTNCITDDIDKNCKDYAYWRNDYELANWGYQGGKCFIFCYGEAMSIIEKMLENEMIPFDVETGTCLTVHIMPVKLPFLLTEDFQVYTNRNRPLLGAK